jgi:hypothetical protein
MLLLRNGIQIRVLINVDPCWNKQDIWTAKNLYGRFISSGYSAADSSSLASAGVWKRKWNGTVYSDWIENALKATT